MDRLIMKLLVSFVMRQIEKFGHSIDWAKVKADLKPRIEALVPGKWFDDEAVTAVNSVLDAAAKALSATADLQKILDLLAAEKWAEALEVLKTLLLSAWHPTGAKQLAFATQLAHVAV
ncbi:MAG: hypothetical protein V4750_02820 [Pseudomonadota bacterium]